jgi:catechol 2,3-dioxygenase-like lactoylglutathione lyase family enzyme
MPRITHSCKTDEPLLGITTISHGTLASVDLQLSRKFYEEVLGLDVIQVSPVSMLVRKGTAHAYVVVETGEPSRMTMMDHNGLDVASREAVNAAFATLNSVKDEYGVKRINKIMEQHGAYSFYFEDRDGNWWEVVAGRGNGYAFAFDEGRDLTGREDVDPMAMEHTFDDHVARRLGQGS